MAIEPTLQNVLTEADLCEILAITNIQLQNLRRKGLPYVTLGRRRRVYFEADVINFLNRFKTVHSTTL